MKTRDKYIHTRNLCIGYRGKHPLAHDINLCLNGGDVVSLIGGNGVGKSTLLRTLCGLLSPLSGEIQVMGYKLSKLSKRQLATYIAVVDTSTGLAGGLTVSQFVELGRQPHTGMLGLLAKEDKAQCLRAMQAVGISHKINEYVATLSDGERQKAMIARALAQDTPVIYLDEPFSFLDPAARLEIMALLRSIASSKNKAILLTCHDVALSLRMASRLWLFSSQGSVADYTPEQAVASGKLNSLYNSDEVVFSASVGDYVICNNYKS